LFLFELKLETASARNSSKFIRLFARLIAVLTMQRYGDFQHKKQKGMISGREACGAYTKIAAEMAMLAITVAKKRLSERQESLLSIGRALAFYINGTKKM